MFDSGRYRTAEAALADAAPKLLALCEEVLSNYRCVCGLATCAECGPDTLRTRLHAAVALALPRRCDTCDVVIASTRTYAEYPLAWSCWYCQRLKFCSKECAHKHDCPHEKPRNTEEESGT
jgi:hypothetical protein